MRARSVGLKQDRFEVAQKIFFTPRRALRQVSVVWHQSNPSRTDATSLRFYFVRRKLCMVSTNFQLHRFKLEWNVSS